MYLSWKEICHSKGRFFFMMLIIALLSYLVFFISGLANGLSSDNASAIEKYSHQTFILQKDADQRINRSALTSDTVNRLRDKLGTDRTHPLNLLTTTGNKVNKEQKIDLTFFNGQPSQSSSVTLIDGKQPNKASTVDIIIDQSIQKSGVHLGDRIKDQLSGLTFRIVGLTKHTTYSHMPVAYLNQAEWHLLSKKAALNSARPLESAAVLTSLSVQEAKELTHGLPLSQDVQVLSAADVIKSLPGYSAEQSSLTMMISFLFLISVFILGVFFYIITVQKRSQFGLLKAIGTGTAYLARSLLFQTLIVLVISLGISLLLTWITALVLPSGMPFALSLATIGTRLAAFFVISMISILLSIYQIIKIDTLSALEGR
ncbi:ABC transporter permease [Sporolactobacillus kofuensis]|uniref:Putative hemin transport system permease protein HrtB n=1 Tax=Sporolactobacillus kofuensis TaxID=269672 RepID=A0ABW1WGK7_9BACL|nr:ABC transporter permease [Sporolactobacillus kofuensis]MCO7175373.1 ABC transporter permease [Sporolactobacillus kofuensis]